jgi:hypothetical protein
MYCSYLANEVIQHGSEGPRGRTWPQNTSTIRGSPDSESGEAR